MELKKKGIVIGILLLWILPLVLAGTEYTPSSETNCDKFGKCTLVQYSGIRYVQEDQTWKKLEDARSLKDKGFSYKYIETDEKYPMEVLDFNFTSVTVNLNPKGIVIFNEAIPLKTWTEPINLADDTVLTGDFKQDYVNTKDSLVDFNIFKQSDTVTLNAKFGDIIEFGFNSTIISLNETGSQNMDDAYVASDAATTNFQNAILKAYRCSSCTPHNNGSLIFRFNLSDVPTNINVEHANLTLSIEDNNLDSTGNEFVNLSIYKVFQNYSWDEGTVTYNLRPKSNQNFSEPPSDTKRINNGDTGKTWWNISSIIADSITSNDKNVSLFIQATDSVANSVTDDVQYCNGEVTSPCLSTADMPRLTIIYSLIQSGSCVYTSGNWNINTHDNCTINSNVNLGGNNLILNGSGTIVMNANITNKGSLVMSSGSKIVLANGVVLG